MAIRIRYEKTEHDNILVSVRNFNSKTTDAMYIVYLNLTEVTYEIRNMVSKRKYTGGENVNNLHVLKRHAKERLEKLGVSFEPEIRDNSTREIGKNCSYIQKEENSQ